MGGGGIVGVLIFIFGFPFFIISAFRFLDLARPPSFAPLVSLSFSRLVLLRPPSKPFPHNKKTKKPFQSYIEKYVAADADPQALREHPATALAPLVHVALALSDVAKLTGRKEPTVIT